MKKTLIALFSVSITAGSTYFIYMQVKEFQIKKQINSWKKEAEKQNKTLDEKQLKQELEKLHSLDLWLLSNYSDKYIQKAPEAEIKPIMEKLKKRKITEKADLKSLTGIIFGT